MLIESLRHKSPPESTLIAVLSDHGESLGEQGEYTHGVFWRKAFRMPGCTPAWPTCWCAPVEKRKQSPNTSEACN